jgi:membrane glycosyltransferase
MDTLRQEPELDVGDVRPRGPFLPRESPLPMSKQELRGPRRGEGEPKIAPAPLALRRTLIFLGTVAMTAAGSYEMYEVVNVGGVTVLEWMVLALFLPLFAWIAFSFMSTIAGFFLLLFRMKDQLGIDPEAPLPPIGSRNAMLLPTYNEDPNRVSTGSC